MTKDEVIKRAEEISWYQSIRLYPDYVTKGVDMEGRMAQLHFPDDLNGKTVLDLGAWDGYFSFLAEQRRASRVLAVDKLWLDNPPLKSGFNLAYSVFGSKVESLACDLYDLTPDKIGTFDVVLFIQVLYHLVDHHRAWRIVSSLARDFVILETQVDMIGFERATMVFHPSGEEWPGLHKGAHAHCWPNPVCITSMARDVGFRRIELVGDCGPDKSYPDSHGSKQGRLVYHLWK